MKDDGVQILESEASSGSLQLNLNVWPVTIARELLCEGLPGWVSHVKKH